MRQVLILGGTAWLGREIARAALENGAEVTCLARGSAGDIAPGARLVQADRAEPGAYDALLGREWDEVVEISYDLGFVQSALDALAARAAHWTLVSSVSVYADDDVPHSDETARLVEPVDLDDYAHAKVAAERATQTAVGDRLFIARPGLIVGPGDGSGRFGYWPGRFAAAAAEGGPILVPDTRDRWSQVIDVRDLAEWIVDAGAAGRTGTVNAVGDEYPRGDVLALAAAASGLAAARAEASDTALVAADVRYWAGPRSLPLWLPAEATGFMRYKNDAYRESGGMLRPLAATIADVRDDEAALGLDRARRSGLTRAEELEVLAALRDDGSGTSSGR